MTREYLQNLSLDELTGAITNNENIVGLLGEGLGVDENGNLIVTVEGGGGGGGGVSIGGHETATGNGSTTEFSWDAGTEETIESVHIDPTTDAARASYEVFSSGTAIGVRYAEPPADGAALGWYWTVNPSEGLAAFDGTGEQIGSFREFETGDNLYGEVVGDRLVFDATGGVSQGTGGHESATGDGTTTSFSWDTHLDDPLEFIHIDPATDASRASHFVSVSGSTISVNYAEPPADGATLGWYWSANAGEGEAWNQTTQTTDYTASDNDSVWADSSSQAVTITLPSPGANVRVRVVNVDNTNGVTLSESPDGEGINDASGTHSTISLTEGESIEVEADTTAANGGSWWVV